MAVSETVIVSTLSGIILFGVVGFGFLLWRIMSNPTVYAAFTAAPAAPDTPAVPNAFYQWLEIFGTDLIHYLPMSLALFGFFADAINQDFRFGIGSLIGISSVFVNYIVSVLGKRFGFVLPSWVNGNPPTVDICTVPGFAAFESVYAPQSIVFTTSIFMYYLIDFVKNRDMNKNIGLLSLFGGLLLIESVTTMRITECRGAYYFTGNSFPLSIILAIFIGSFYGYLGWQTVSIVAPSKLPSSINETFINKSIPVIKSDKLPGVGKCKSGAEKCDAPSDKEQDQFVCEAYKNGELITSTIAE